MADFLTIEVGLIEIFVGIILGYALLLKHFTRTKLTQTPSLDRLLLSAGYGILPLVLLYIILNLFLDNQLSNSISILSVLGVSVYILYKEVGFVYIFWKKPTKKT